jgi:DHA1 family chloramphenicol resistance protein-like MFS transporter
MTLAAIVFVAVSLRLHSRSRIVMGAMAAEPEAVESSQRV